MRIGKNRGNFVSTLIRYRILILIILIVLISFGWVVSELGKKEHLLVMKTKELDSLKERLMQIEANYSELTEKYLTLNSSYYDLIERIKPYFIIDTEKQTKIFTTNLSVVYKLDLFSKISFQVIDKDTQLAYKIVEPNEYELIILNSINEIRKKQNLTTLRLNKAISYVARSHSEDMAERSYFDHETPEGITLTERLIKNNLYFLYAGENIMVIDSKFINKTVENWMKSPGHRAILLNDDFNEVGVGVYCIYNETYCYVTADFVSTVKSSSTQLSPGYVTFYYLFDPNTDVGFSQPIKVKIKFQASQSVNFYIVSSEEDFRYYINTGNKKYVENVGSVSNLEREFVVYKGYGIMLDNEGSNTVYYNITISYISV